MKHIVLFDQLHKSGIMTRAEAYLWLANILAVPLSEAHIGYLREYYCHVVIDESKKYLEEGKWEDVK